MADGLCARLIVNADDFGRSASVNAAVLEAHTRGILTTASLMVNEAGSAEAVALARQHPTLGVGLHLTLVCGQSACGHGPVPGFIDSDGQFTDEPVRAGLRFFFRRDLREALRVEMAAQFEAFHATGLPLDHVNGHLHFHLHPVVLRLLIEHADAWGIRRMRWTRDPFWLNARLAAGRWGYRACHALIYRGLSAYARPYFRRQGIGHTRAVFGLLQHAAMDEAYLVGLLGRLGPGDYELYSHPSLDEFKHELDALLSPRVKALVRERGFRLVRYQDLEASTAWAKC